MNPSTRIVSSLQKKTTYSYSEKKEARKTRLVSTSPSAWALSPGRSPKMELQLQLQPQKTKMGGGVFKYFRQKKVCPIREEEFHRFRVFHNTLVQWRWANARAEAAMAATKIVAEVGKF